MRKLLLAIILSTSAACAPELPTTFTATVEDPPIGPAFTVRDFGTSRDNRLIYHGQFWAPDVEQGKTSWDGWVRPNADAGSTYWFRDGYGGRHVIMGGFISLSGKLYQYLQVWNATTAKVIYGDDPIEPGETHHWQGTYDGSYLRLYKNGVLNGISPYSGGRVAKGIPGYGSGWLGVGASDHNAFSGRISQIRAWEGSCPPWGNSAFAPQSNLSAEVYINGVFYQPNFLAHYTDTDATIFEDLSPVGFNEGIVGGIPQWHPGTPWNANGGYWPWGNRPNGTLPEPVVDLTFPHGQPGTRELPNIPLPTRPATPSGTLVFDSFSRPESVLAFDNEPTLGQTESGSEGPLLWKTGPFGKYGYTKVPKKFGIVGGGRAAYLDKVPGIAWVNTSTTDGVVSVDRRIGLANAGFQWTGLTFRVTDTDNFWYVWLGASGLQLGRVTNGYIDFLTGTPWPSTLQSCPTIKAKAVAENIQVFGCSTKLIETADTTHQNAAGWGLAHYGDAARSPTSIVRYDNFTVSPAN